MSTSVTVFKNTVGTSSDADDVQETLSSIQRLMALSGLSWDYKHSKTEQRCTPSAVASGIYSSLVCIVFILMFVQEFPLYAKADSLTDTTIAILSHTVFVLSLIYWGLSTNIHSKIRIFCQRLREARLKFKSSVSNSLLRKRIKRTCLCIQVFAALSFVASGLAAFMTNEQSQKLYWSLFVCSAVYGGCNTLLNLSLLLLVLSISLLLTYEYDVCTLRLVQASGGCVKEEEIEDIRDYHALLTDLVDYVCSFISIHVAAAYLSSFLIICFCLYVIINDGSSIQFISFTAYAVFVATLNLITLTYLGIRLHGAAHRPLIILHGLAGRKMSDRVLGLLHFLEAGMRKRNTFDRQTTLSVHKMCSLSYISYFG
ncbi:uncharacterized protein LOC124270670 [Haliotis rubra]|uniref:uncharacterized protein LOC124270670 n=1 Tax=Haliotis rubra TaxID=36100 RepID=UPI001EE5513A|nr:uncharacterized protein LOC124270670 [Haliotis rubra]